MTERKRTYHILRLSPREQYAAIEDDPRGIEETWLVSDGESLASAIQGRIAFAITKRHKGMKLDDFIPNLLDCLVVTARVKDLLHAECANVEVYPIDLKDQKGKLVKEPYFLVQPVGTVECLDRARSKFEARAGEPEKVHTFEKMLLDEKRIPKDLKVFRLAEQPQVIIIRSDLVEKLLAIKAGGFELWELGDPILL